MQKTIKKCLQLILVLGLVFSGLMGQSISHNVSALLEDSKTSLSFSSSKSNYLEVERNFDYLPKTLETTIKFGKADNKRKVIMGNYVYNKNCFSLELTANNQLRYVEYAYENGNQVTSIDYKINIPELFDEAWHHLGFVRDIENNQILFYEDGILKDTLVLEGTVLKDNVPLDQVHYIGTDARKTYFLDADIHEIRLWDTLRTAAEIDSDKEKVLTGKEAGLQSNWVLDKAALDTENTTIKNKVKDQPGLTAVNFDLPKPRTFLEFESAKKSYVELTKTLETAPNTIDFWAKLDENPNQRQIIFSNYVYGKNAMGIEITADNQLRYVEFAYENSQLSGNLDVRTVGQDICNNKWSHFAIVRDIENSAVKIYQDGKELVNKQLTNQGTDRLTAELSFDNKHYLGTDKRANSSYYLDGQIDKFTLWQDSKSTEEVKELSNINVSGNEAELLHSWDFDYDSLSSTNPIIKDKKSDGIDGLAVNFEFSDIPQYENDGTDFSTGEIEIEMTDAFDQAPLTFETWLKMPKSAASSRGGVIAGNLFDAYIASIPIVNFEIFNNGVPRLYWTVEGKTYDYKATGINVCTNQWTHLAIAYDQENKKMVTYINGEKVHEANFEVDVQKLDQPMKIGKDSRDAYNFKGEIADLRIWSTTRDEEQIKSNYNTELENETGLLGSWKLDKDVDNQYLDSSTNQNHAQNYWIDEDLFSKSEDGYNSIAVIPDTQTLAMSAPASFTKLTKWIKNNQQELGIGAAIHVGDIVNERNSHSEWQNAKNAMNELNGVVPYVFSAGNHDVEIKKIDGKWYGLRNTPLMNKYFPYSEVSNQPTYGGTYKEGEVDNTYSYFTINNVDFMFISLEESPRVEVLQWANKITEENSDKKVIVTTHEYLYYDGNLITQETPDHLEFVGGSTAGDEMWDKYVKKHENITAVVSGHVGYPDLVSTKKVGDNGNVVTQILCDGQFMDRDDVNNGSGKGLGMVMILSFKEGTDEIKVNWYSTVREQFYREKNQYTDTMSLTSEVKETDKTALQIAIEAAKNASLENVIPAVVEEFKAALEQAIAINDKANATQDEVDKAFDRLAKAMHMLEFFKGDKKALNEFINKVKNLTETEYTADTWKTFQAALDKAKSVYENDNAMQGEVDQTYTELVKAFVNLRYKPNKDLLEDLVNKANGLDAANYTADSWGRVANAVNDAKAVLDNSEATVEEVNNANNALTKALSGLVAKPVDTGTPDTPVKPSSKVNGKESAVKTGDEVVMLYPLAGLAIASLVLYKNKKYYN